MGSHSWQGYFLPSCFDLTCTSILRLPAFVACKYQIDYKNILNLHVLTQYDVYDYLVLLSYDHIVDKDIQHLHVLTIWYMLFKICF